MDQGYVVVTTHYRKREGKTATPNTKTTMASTVLAEGMLLIWHFHAEIDVDTFLAIQFS